MIRPEKHRDYKLMKDYAKLWGIVKFSNDSFVTTFPFGETFITCQFFYQGKELSAIEVELDAVYKTYGTGKFASIQDFLNAVKKECYYFETKETFDKKQVLCVEETKNDYPGTYTSFDGLKNVYESTCKVLSLDMKAMSQDVALDGSRVANIDIKERREVEEKFKKILKFASIGAGVGLVFLIIGAMMKLDPLCIIGSIALILGILIDAFALFKLIKNKIK